MLCRIVQSLRCSAKGFNFQIQYIRASGDASGDPTVYKILVGEKDDASGEYKRIKVVREDQFKKETTCLELIIVISLPRRIRLDREEARRLRVTNTFSTIMRSIQN
jgi:hypothetical protein